MLREQTKAMEETVGILGTVTDKASMATARAELNKRRESQEALSRRAKQLKPPTPEIMGQVQEDAAKLQQAFERYREQIRRINALPGGEEFLQSLGDRTKVP